MDNKCGKESDMTERLNSTELNILMSDKKKKKRI